MKVRRVEKPWGYELLLACTERYAGKILGIRAGQRLSLQHHVAKDETLYLLEGELELELEAAARRLRPRRMAPDRSYRIRAGRRHRLTALTDARVLEVSTPELDDVVRWEDDYGRERHRSAREGLNRRDTDGTAKITCTETS
jgi:mannose-6-phosphate isomerase